MHTEKGAAEHCCRTAPGVNNRSLASDLRVQRYELFTRRRDRLPSCACGHGSHDLAAAVHDPVVEPHKEVRSGDLGLGAENGLALSGVGRCIPGEDLLVGQPLPGLRELLEDSFYEDWNAVLVELPYPRLRMYLRPRVLAAVTPFAEPDISSKAMEGLYFIT